MQKTRSRKSGVKATDVVKLRGCLQMQLHNALVGDPNYGNPVGDKVVIDNIPIFLNTVVTSGRRWVLSRIYTNDAQTISHLAVGTGTTAPATGNTALGSETTRLNMRGLKLIKSLRKFFLIDSNPEMAMRANLAFC